jgi:hypothetical protein
MMDARAGYRLTEALLISLAAQQFNTFRLVETAGPPVERRVILGITVHL